MSRFDSASQILGRDFISPEDVVQRRSGVTYSKERLREFRRNFPDEDLLRQCAGEGFVLLPSPPSARSLHGVRSMDPSLFFKGRGWYLGMKEPFAYREKVRLPWFAMRKEQPPTWLNKPFDGQRQLLPYVERVLNAVETAWFLTTYRAVIGTPLLPGIALRTSSIARNGDRVYVGFDGDTGVNIWHLDDWQPDPHIGLASTLMF